jgi:L-asparagine oxygenase
MTLSLTKSTSTSEQLKTAHLSDIESSWLFKKLMQMETTPYDDQEAFLKESYNLFRKHLPDSIFDEVANLRRNLDSEGYLLIQNLPNDRKLEFTVSNTMATWEKQSFVSEACLTGIGQLIGEIFGYKNENNSRIIHNVYPQKQLRQSISNAGSEVTLPLHTEDVHAFPYLPDFLAIYCLRSEPNCKVFTYILSVKQVLSGLNAEILETLRSPLYYIDPPQSFGGASQRSKEISVIHGSYEHPHITTEFTDMHGVCPEACKALEIFKEACNKSPHLKRVNLEPGNLIIFDNRKIIHGRSSFHASFSEEGRWCQRIFIKCGDLWDWRDELYGSRILNF